MRIEISKEDYEDSLRFRSRGTAGTISHFAIAFWEKNRDLFDGEPTLIIEDERGTYGFVEIEEKE